MINEGRCCDAVLRILERRLGPDRSNLSFDTKERASVEVECNIGSQHFALEHTLIEPYDGKSLEDLVIVNVLDPVANLAKERNLLPSTGVYYLMIKGGTGRELRRGKFEIARTEILSWIRQEIEQIPPYSEKRSVIFHENSKVPFDVTLFRERDTGSGLLFAARSMPDQLESQRKRRITRALEKKLPKLEICHRDGAYSVLILEDQDIAISNHILIADAVDISLQGKPFCPDEIFLVQTYIETSWTIWVLRRNNLGLIELQEKGETEVVLDPSKLLDITSQD